MKNLPASDMTVGKAKGWNELSPAENTQDYKRAIFVTLRARRTTTRHWSPAWRGWCDAHRWQQTELPSLWSACVFCQEGWDASHKENRGHWWEGTEVQTRCCDCQSACSLWTCLRLWPCWIKLHATAGMRWEVAKTSLANSEAYWRTGDTPTNEKEGK